MYNVFLDLRRDLFTLGVLLVILDPLDLLGVRNLGSPWRQVLFAKQGFWILNNCKGLNESRSYLLKF